MKKLKFEMSGEITFTNEPSTGRKLRTGMRTESRFARYGGSYKHGTSIVGTNSKPTKNRGILTLEISSFSSCCDSSDESGS